MPSSTVVAGKLAWRAILRDERRNGIGNAHVPIGYGCALFGQREGGGLNHSPIFYWNSSAQIVLEIFVTISGLSLASVNLIGTCCFKYGIHAVSAHWQSDCSSLEVYDNKCYLQALRHLWVLAVEPRCLVAQIIETKEVLYLPVQFTMREGKATGTTPLIAPTLLPDLHKLLSVRVDTPRYWPFYLDTEKVVQHKEAPMRIQTFYTEDSRGSRSLLVRSRSSAGDAASLDYPQLTDTKTHLASDLWEFIPSFPARPSSSSLFSDCFHHFRLFPALLHRSELQPLSSWSQVHP
ncbi:hypothetical protein FB446DRAFT_828531 [Lentinula raphanica]|nr:hypothetical protein FB446DRAFT_828531 [Lentinula raphanica]